MTWQGASEAIGGTASHLLAEEGDLGVRIADLVALVECYVAPVQRQEHVGVPPQYLVAGEDDTTATAACLGHVPLDVRLVPCTHGVIARPITRRMRTAAARSAGGHGRRGRTELHVAVVEFDDAEVGVPRVQLAQPVLQRGDRRNDERRAVLP